MPFHVKHPDTDRMARALAKARGTGLTEAVHHALTLARAAEQAKAALPDGAAGFARERRATAANDTAG